jgi:bacterioferritin-associated ferredoxin
LLVCHCHRICDRTIRESVRQGASSVAEVGAACRAGTGCGGCRPIIAGLLAAHRADPPAKRALATLEPIALRLAS